MTKAEHIRHVFEWHGGWMPIGDLVDATIEAGIFTPAELTRRGRESLAQMCRRALSMRNEETGLPFAMYVPKVKRP